MFRWLAALIVFALLLFAGAYVLAGRASPMAISYVPAGAFGYLGSSSM